MATAYLCDGCRSPVENPVKVGHVLKRDYCETCAPRAQAFVEAEENLRADLVATFQSARRRMIEAATEDKFLLPDVPV